MAGEVMRMPNQEVSRRPDGSNGRRGRPVFVPRSDVYETGDSIVIMAEMPGVSPDHVDIMLERRMLTVRGSTLDAAHEGYRKVYAEYDEGEYERVFTLPEEIYRDNIKAVHKDGVLKLELPKAEPVKAKRIEVKGS
jgi:HSP20 family protein